MFREGAKLGNLIAGLSQALITAELVREEGNPARAGTSRALPPPPGGPGVGCGTTQPLGLTPGISCCPCCPFCALLEELRAALGIPELSPRKLRLAECEKGCLG